MPTFIDRAKLDLPSQLPQRVIRPLYAGVGATDRVVEVVRTAAADFQARAIALQKQVSELDYEPQALRRQATAAVADRVDGLQSDAKDLPVRLQKLVDDGVTTAGVAFDGLVKRGETLVGRIRRQPSTAATASSAQTTVAKARTTRTQASKTAASAKTSASRTTKKAAKSPARSSAKATSTTARATAANATQAAADAAKKVGD
jgi:heparin binding hemagglutinin HbhA